MLGQILVWLQFKPHYEAEENAGNILATFSTGPAIKDTVSNLISEIIGTFVLVLTIFALGLYDFQAGIGTFAVSTLIVGIGLSLGGTTGYALNPARDLGPRIMHSIIGCRVDRILSADLGSVFVQRCHGRNGTGHIFRCRFAHTVCRADQAHAQSFC